MNFDGCQYVIYRHTDTQHDNLPSQSDLISQQDLMGVATELIQKHSLQEKSVELER